VSATRRLCGMHWPVAVGLVMVMVALAAAVLVWRDRRRGPVCPWCGKPDTFGGDGSADVCSNCGFDIRTDDY
jgi:NADH pyrophosphatase NudC (nudix superfamily)